MSTLPIIKVATATILPFNGDDPYLVVVGRSSKHNGKLVLPGGKIERKDDGIPEKGAECAIREVFEETGLIVNEVRKVGEATDQKRTPRFVSVADLARTEMRPTLGELQLDPLVDASVILEAHYGIPDEIFVGAYTQFTVPEGELELSDIQEFDIRGVSDKEFSAAHDVLLLWYRWMLEVGSESFPPFALKNFTLERQVLTEFFISGSSSSFDHLQ